MSTAFVGDLYEIDASSPYYFLVQEGDVVRIKKWNASDVAQCVRNKTIQNACDVIALLFIIASISICVLNIFFDPHGYMLFSTVSAFIGISCLFYKATSSLPTQLAAFPFTERMYSADEFEMSKLTTVANVFELSQQQLARLYSM